MSAGRASIRTSADVRAWVDTFRRLHGRSPRILHIGNIANNAFRNAAIQRSYGIEADVVCYDYYHVMGCPEWEWNTIEAAYDPFAPDWWRVKVGGPARPEWFLQGPQADCRALLRARISGSRWRRIKARLALINGMRSWLLQAAGAETDAAERSDLLASANLPATRRLAPELNVWPAWLIRILFKIDRMQSPSWWRDMAEIGRAGLAGRAPQGEAREWVLQAAKAGRAKTIARLAAALPAAAFLSLWRRASPASFADLADPPIDLSAADRKTALRAMHRAVFPDLPEGVLEGDIALAQGLAAGWADILAHYDIVQGYSLDGVIPLACGHPRFLAYEHGTIREIPFEDSARGRLCWLTYRQAPRALITNSDVLPATERMGLDPARLVLMPHAFDDADLQSYRSRLAASAAMDGRAVFFAPARHHWTGGGGSWEKGNDVYLRAAGRLAREGHDFRLALVAWGEDVEASKRLIQELDLEDRVEWLPLLDKEALYSRCLASNCVIDQFRLPALGGVSYEALTLGCRVITMIDRPVLERFFGEAPPLLDAGDEAEAAERMRQVIRDPADTAGVGAASARWAQAFHSTERLMALQAEAYAEILEMREQFSGPARSD